MITNVPCKHAQVVSESKVYTRNNELINQDA